MPWVPGSTRANHLPYAPRLRICRTGGHAEPRHLHYFWVVTRRAACPRGESAGHGGADHQRPGARAGSRSATSCSSHWAAAWPLTEAGKPPSRAEEIFQLGQVIPRRGPAQRPAARSPGWRSGSPTASPSRRPCAAEPVLNTPNLRLVCHEGEFEQLLGELALHHLDLVLAGQAAPRNPNLRLTSEAARRCTGRSGTGRPGSGRQGRARPLSDVAERPAGAAATGHSGPAPDRWIQWFRREGLRPRIGQRVRGQARCLRFRRPRSGRDLGQPARRGRCRPDERTTLARPQRRREGGGSRHPIAPRPASTRWRPRGEGRCQHVP